MNSIGTPETNLGMTVMPRRRHHRSHQGREEKLRKITTDEWKWRGKWLWKTQVWQTKQSESPWKMKMTTPSLTTATNPPLPSQKKHRKETLQKCDFWHARKNGGKNKSNERDHGTKRKRGRARWGQSDGINSLVAPRMIIDPGTDIDVIGGVGWFILNIVDETTANLGGALAGMGEQRLPIVSIVTAYDHEMEGPILIGHGQVAWMTDPSIQNV